MPYQFMRGIQALQAGWCTRWRTRSIDRGIGAPLEKDRRATHAAHKPSCSHQYFVKPCFSNDYPDK